MPPLVTKLQRWGGSVVLACSILPLAGTVQAQAQFQAQPQVQVQAQVQAQARAQAQAQGQSHTPWLKPALVATQGNPKLYRLPLPALRANEPVWMGTQGKLAFLGYQESGGLVDIEVWDPAGKRLGRSTPSPGMRHSLVSAPDGRVAYIEHDAARPPTPTDAAYLPGQDSIVVYDFNKGSRKIVFDSGQVLPRSLAWSRDGLRIAFLCVDSQGVTRLALLESGKPLVITKMPVPYGLSSIVGWIGDHEVLAVATQPSGLEVLLRIGKTFSAIPDGELPKLSFDGRLLLTKSTASTGVMLRGAAGGGHTLSQAATAYAWGPNNTVLVAVNLDVLALNYSGQVVKRYVGAAGGPLDDMIASPDGHFVALLAAHNLEVLAL
jgi:hypothetical protein